MNEYRKIEIPQPGLDPEKPVPGFISDARGDMLASREGGAPIVGSQDLGMLPESDGEDF